MSDTSKLEERLMQRIDTLEKLVEELTKKLKDLHTYLFNDGDHA